MGAATGVSDGGPLPDVLPIFPLAGVLLLPGGRLPLHIFEPRYLNMAGDALAGDRLIGIIQPLEPEQASSAGSVGDEAAVYGTGCAGRIAESSETPDGRLMVTLAGVSRFHVADELPLDKGYRRVKPDWQAFAGDLEGSAEDLPGRAALLGALERYFAARGVNADWDEIRAWPGTTLVSAMAMMCPFDPGEKQALLECADWEARARLLTTLVDMAALDGTAGGDAIRH